MRFSVLQEIKDLENLGTALRGLNSSLQAIIGQRKLKRKFRNCNQLIDIFETISDNLFGVDRAIFVCLQQESENISCNETEKEELKNFIKSIEVALKESKDMLSEKQQELNKVDSEIESLSPTSTSSSTVSTLTPIDTTAIVENLNCTKILNLTQPTLEVLFPTGELIFNGNSTENVILATVKGKEAVQEVFDLATYAFKSIGSIKRAIGNNTENKTQIGIKCCDSGGK